MPQEYRCLTKNEFSFGRSFFCPIRFEDRYQIMEWRNAQVFHLRQSKILTPKDQDTYFTEVVSALFTKKKPQQILFSYDYDQKFIGYGGLVHIDYANQSAELSFLLNPRFSNEKQAVFWREFFYFVDNLVLHLPDISTIYGYCYDVRPWLYPLYNEAGYTLTCVKKDEIEVDNHPVDVHIYTKTYS